MQAQPTQTQGAPSSRSAPRARGSTREFRISLELPTDPVTGSPRCYLCRRPFRPVRRQYICEDPLCQALRQELLRLIRTRRDKRASEVSCRFCQEPPVSGSHFCLAHVWRRQRCSCGARVRRSEGAGGQFEQCEACRSKTKGRAKARG